MNSRVLIASGVRYHEGGGAVMLYDHPDFDQHEQVIFCTNNKIGLRAIIALHSTALGPAAGGCRMYPYETEADAVADALRLSKGMTYKNAVAGLPLGGGKYVIIADPANPKKNPNCYALLQCTCNP